MFSVLSLTSLLPSRDRNKYGGIWGDGRLSSSKDALFATAIRFIDEYFSLFAALPANNFSYLSSTSSIIIHLQSLFCAISSSAVSSLNNICHKCTSVLNKKTGTVAPDDLSNSPVDSLREKVVVSKLKENTFNEIETLLRLFEKKNENFPKHILVNISDI